MQVSLTPVLPRVRMGMSPTLGLAGFAAAALPMPANAAPKKVRLRIPYSMRGSGAERIMLPGMLK
jgi:hypothetical protein